MNRTAEGSIRTLKERCRVCYTCVRECPAKAIRINDGQAEVLAVRCIGCGNCVRVCSQGAKQVVSTVGRAEKFLAYPPRPTVAMLAPSFPAEFTEMDERMLAGQLRALGFAGVYEVGFGADLVARSYREIVESGDTRSRIATTCPAVVLYVEKYYPGLVDSLAPVVSPMVAMARVVRRIHANQRIRVVFIGPCIAKKCEGVDELLRGDVDAVLTFTELRQMLTEAGSRVTSAAPADFDPPRAGLGALFALSRGLLQAAEIPEDLLAKEVIATDGRTNFVDAIKAFDAGALDTRLLEVLACEGCIMGAGMTSPQSLFRRRAAVSDYARRKMNGFDLDTWRRDMSTYRTIDMTRRFAANDQRIPPPTETELRAILSRMGKEKPEHELNCGACGYDSCREHAVAIHKGLAESEMCLPYTIDRLNRTVDELARSNSDLASAQEALMQSERLASMGQLAAGVAHEVNNPLGVVLMYAHLLLDELKTESEHREDVVMIVEQADRCKKIVGGLLHFARQNRVLRQPTNVPRLVGHCLKMMPHPENVAVEVRDTMAEPVADLDADQITQVMTNLISNAYAAMPEGGTLQIETRDTPRAVTLTVRDTGSGIRPDLRSKVFEPFFTTKQMGKGTGLGLAVTYGIVKMHRGSIRLESNDDPAQGPTGTTFYVDMPRNGEDEPAATPGAANEKEPIPR